MLLLYSSNNTCSITYKPSFLYLKVLKGKLTKPRWKLTHVELSKNMLLRQKIWKTNKLQVYGLMKIWSNFNNSKILNYQIVKAFKKKIPHMNFLSYITSYIEFQ
jgi:hypothetical protein